MKPSIPYRLSWSAILPYRTLACLTALLIGSCGSGLRADEASASKEGTSLSVAPLMHTEYAPSRPDWIDQAPSRVGSDDLVPVSSVPCRDEKLCDEALLVALRAATETYVESLTGNDQLEKWLKVDDQWLRNHRDLKKQYHGPVTIGNETLHESATMLRFSEQDRQEILQQWEQLQVSQRLVGLTIVGFLIVSGLIGSTALLSIIVRRAELRVTT